MRGSPQTPPPAACPELGLQRVSWVRIVLGRGEPRCQVAGVAHRRPVVRTLPLRTAAALVAAGVPAFVRSSHTAPAPPSPARDHQSVVGH